MTFELIEQQLIEFSNKYNLRKRALDFCDEMLQFMQEEGGLGKYQYSHLKCIPGRQEFIYKHASKSPYLRTRCLMYNIAKGYDEYVGFFDLDVDEKGEYQEDWIFLEENASSQYEEYEELLDDNDYLKIYLEDIGKEVLELGSPYHEYLSIASKAILFYQIGKYSLCQEFIVTAIEYQNTFKEKPLPNTVSSLSKFMKILAERMQGNDLIDPMFEIKMIEFKIIPYRK